MMFYSISEFDPQKRTRHTDQSCWENYASEQVNLIKEINFIIDELQDFVSDQREIIDGSAFFKDRAISDGSKILLTTNLKCCQSNFGKKALSLINSTSVDLAKIDLFLDDCQYSASELIRVVGTMYYKGECLLPNELKKEARYVL